MKLSILKRSWAAAGALLLFGSVLAGGASAAEKVKVRLDYLPYGLHSPFYYAIEQGWFAEKGLDVQIDDGNGSTTALALISSGEYDVAYITLGAMMLAKDKGMPVMAIGAVARKGDFGLVADANRGINSPKDLEGKSVLYSNGSIETPFIDIYLDRAGVDKSKVDLVNVDISAKVSTYMAGKADAMLTTVPLYTIPGNMPRESVGMLYSDVGIMVPSFGLVTNVKTVDARPQVLADFVATFQKSWNAIYHDGQVDAAVDALLKHRPNANLKPDVMKAQVKSFFPYLYSAASEGKPLLWMPPSDWESAVQVFEELKLIKAGTKVDELYTNQFVPAE